jgi:hypothetical protein
MLYYAILCQTMPHCTGRLQPTAQYCTTTLRRRSLALTFRRKKCNATLVNWKSRRRIRVLVSATACHRCRHFCSLSLTLSVTSLSRHLHCALLCCSVSMVRCAIQLALCLLAVCYVAHAAGFVSELTYFVLYVTLSWCRLSLARSRLY